MNFKIAPEGIKLREIDQWGDLYEAMERGTPVEATLKRVRRTGANGETGSEILELEFEGRPDITGYLNVRECGLPEKAPLNEFVGQKMYCKVKKIDKKNNAVVCSRKELVEETLKRIIGQTEQGEIIGSVVRAVNRSLYVDIGGGVILKIGPEKARLSDGVPLDLQYEKLSRIAVKVTALDKEERIIRVEPVNPWENQDFKRGETIWVRVLLVRDNIAFVQVKPGIIGRLYYNVNDRYGPGDNIEVQVTDCDPARRRLHLKMWDGRRVGDRRRERARRNAASTDGAEKIRTLGGFRLEEENGGAEGAGQGSRSGETTVENGAVDKSD
ncbi:MAG: RNA-binding protein [Firmicutes bacterium]|nr:RNA-binding protein [Bacillota bacterium]